MAISPYTARMIANAQRRSRLANKAIENKGKPAPNSSDIVQTTDFIFAPIQPLNRIGDSGQLLLAKRKDDPTQRYLVKHAHTDCACNEFIYTKLAQAMGYRMPDAVLFQLSPGEKRTYFETEYIIGERFLHLVNESPSFADIREQARNWRDYFGLYALCAMTGEGDGLETPIADDQLLYRIDTTSAFPIIEYQLDCLGVNEEIMGVCVHEMAQKWLFAQSFENTVNTSCCDFHLSICLEMDNGCLNDFLEPFARIQEIRSDYVDDFLNTLCCIYPDCIADYFKRYIAALQKQSGEYLRTKR